MICATGFFGTIFSDGVFVVFGNVCSGIQISGTGGVVLLIGMSGISVSLSGGGGGSCGGKLELVGMLLPERWGLCE